MDIIVTTPKNEIEKSKQEAEQIKEDGGGLYFRRFNRLPCLLNIGDRIFYTEDGYVRGFAVVNDIVQKNAMGCDTTGRQYPKGYYAFMDASTWKWIDPIPYKGFQGFRYFEQSFNVVGDWEDDAPEIK